ncbi:hypothetical protein FSW04_13820 [Baekduia soli]|uniref:Uncharacterized protein n=1 Tax=Baekduia soli TaxID=496014 RepID=A0A5B8U5Z0_9ACTN|nr:hypothetical protein [Baekduia soli]QEC48536.1 hypothetical protein FSW04_13820 [Baekduia soli]
MTTYAITTRPIADWFRKFNRGKEYRDHVRAFGFLLSPVVQPFGKPLGLAGKPFLLVAPYDKTQSAWATTTFVDTYTRADFKISTTKFDTQTARVRTYREIATKYLDHPDPRRLDANGLPCRRATSGLLGPRHVNAVDIEQIGKEANRVDETAAGLIQSTADIYTTYTAPSRDRWTQQILPVLRDIPAKDLVRETGLSSSALAESVAGRSEPHSANRRRLVAAAQRHAREHLRKHGAPIPRNKTALLHAYLALRAQQVERCCPCGKLLPSRNATYCGHACKQRAYRLRVARDGG